MKCCHSAVIEQSFCNILQEKNISDVLTSYKHLLAINFIYQILKKFGVNIYPFKKYLILETTMGYTLRDSLRYFSVNRSRLVEQTEKGPLSRATDGSNDEGLS